jgi:hypothetical protein
MNNIHTFEEFLNEAWGSMSHTASLQLTKTEFTPYADQTEWQKVANDFLGLTRYKWENLYVDKNSEKMHPIGKKIFNFLSDRFNNRGPGTSKTDMLQTKKVDGYQIDYDMRLDAVRVTDPKGEEVFYFTSTANF